MDEVMTALDPVALRAEVERLNQQTRHLEWERDVARADAREWQRKVEIIALVANDNPDATGHEILDGNMAVRIMDTITKLREENEQLRVALRGGGGEKIEQEGSNEQSS